MYHLRITLTDEKGETEEIRQDLLEKPDLEDLLGLVDDDPLEGRIVTPLPPDRIHSTKGIVTPKPPSQFGREQNQRLTDLPESLQPDG